MYVKKLVNNNANNAVLTCNEINGVLFKKNQSLITQGANGVSNFIFAFYKHYALREVLKLYRKNLCIKFVYHLFFIFSIVGIFYS